jgi:hypothetical protein
MPSENIKILREQYQLVIPNGINYGIIPKQYHSQLLLLEEALFPFMVVKGRVAIKPNLSGVLMRAPLVNMFEAVLVDVKSFHCTIGGFWELEFKPGSHDRPSREIEWVSNIIAEIRLEYRRKYSL